MSDPKPDWVIIDMAKVADENLPTGHYFLRDIVEAICARLPPIPTATPKHPREPERVGTWGEWDYTTTPPCRSWQCPEPCGFLHSSRYDSCAACGAKRPTPDATDEPESPSWRPEPFETVDEAGNRVNVRVWECPHPCRKSHTEDVEACYECKVARPAPDRAADLERVGTWCKDPKCKPYFDGPHWHCFCTKLHTVCLDTMRRCSLCKAKRPGERWRHCAGCGLTWGTDEVTKKRCFESGCCGSSAGACVIDGVHRPDDCRTEVNESGGRDDE